MTKLRVDNVDKIYFGGYVGVKGVDFTLDKGEVLTIFGKKGSGKSTLLKLISTLESPSSGSIKMDDVDVSTMDTRSLNISFATKELPLFKGKTIYDNLAYPLKIRKVDEEVISSRISKVSSIFGLDSILDEKAKYLSKSLTARVILARAFMKESDFYLFDNILEDFTLENRDEALGILSMVISRVSGGIIYATDRLEEVSIIGGSKLIILSNGNMIDRGDISDIYRNADALESLRLLSNHTISEVVTKVIEDDNGYYVDVFGKHYIDIDKVYEGKDIIVAIKSENISYSKSDGEDSLIVTHVYRMPTCDMVVANIMDSELIIKTTPNALKEGDNISVNIEDIDIFDIVSERRIISPNTRDNS